MARVLRLATICLALLPTLARGERLPVKVYTTADGLPNNVINCIVRDARGFLWFCTREGLSRFDGDGFTAYGADHGLPSNVITAFLQSSTGQYWIGTGSGLVRFDPLGVAEASAASGRRAAFVNYSPDGDRRERFVTALIERRNGELWMGTLLGVFRVATRDALHPAITAVSLGDAMPEVNALAEDASGAVWIGTSAGLFRHRDGEPALRVTSPFGRPGDAVRALLADRSGRLWVGSTTGGLAVVVADAGHGVRVERTYTRENGLRSNWVHQIVAATDGSIWAATTNGIVRFEVGANGDYTLRTHGTAEGLPFPEALAIGEDRNRNLWVGTSIGAAKILADGFTIFTAQDGVPTAASMLATPDGQVMVMDGGTEWCVNRFDGRRFITTRIPPARLQATWGWSQMFLIDRQGDWWLGTRAGVWRFHGLRHAEALADARPAARYDHRDGLAADVVLRLLEDSRGDIWIATVGEGQRPNGLTRWERHTGAFHHYTDRDGLPPLDQYFVSALIEDGAGNVWIGLSGDGGLARYQNGRLTVFRTPHGVPAGLIRNLAVDSRGRLWAASYRGGLIRSDNPIDATPTFARYTTAEGLSSNEVHAIAEDMHGRIYAGTGRGLDRIEPTTGRIKSYRAGEGPLLGEMQSAIRDRGGAMWFSYNSGVVRLVPTAETVEPAPVVLITGLRVAGRRSPISAVGETDLVPIELARDDNSLEIDFVAPGFGPREGLTYQFMLEGADRGWSSPTEQRTVSYANLAPGRYRFVVRASTASGTTSASTAAFAFTVLSPIWQRWWFVTGAVLCIAAVLHAVHRYRVSRLIELANLRTRIASDLHDDIGANLTRIAVLTEVARRHVGQAPPADRHLEAIATVARESVTAMSDIVWAVSPECDTVQELGLKIREYAEETLAEGETAVHFTPPPTTREVKLAGDIRRDIYLIAKEAINNASRHARCSSVAISLHVDARRLILTVSDDGVGFKVTSNGGGDGLPNLRRRAARLHATLQVSSRPGAGTAVRLEVPLTGDRDTPPQRVGDSDTAGA